MWGIPHRLSLAWQHTNCINWKHPPTAIRRLEYTSQSTLGWDGHVEFANILHQYQISADTTSDHLDGFENIDFLEDPRYIRITVKIYRYPVVNIVPSTGEQMGDYFCEAQGAFLVLPNFGFEGIGREIKLYMHVQWDTSSPDDYDSAQEICAVTYDIDLRCLLIMLLKDHNTHYERVGLAMTKPQSHDTSIKKGAGLSKSTSTTRGIQNLIARDNPDFYWGELWSDGEQELGWIREREPVTITLG